VVRVVEGSLTDEEALKDAMAGVDTVVSFVILSCQLRGEALDVLATPFHATYFCATGEC